jgi:hypothetical protein
MVHIPLRSPPLEPSSAKLVLQLVGEVVLRLVAGLGAGGVGAGAGLGVGGLETLRARRAFETLWARRAFETLRARRVLGAGGGAEAGLGVGASLVRLGRLFFSLL